MTSDDENVTRPGGRGPRLTQLPEEKEGEKPEPVISPRREKMEVARAPSKRKPSGNKKKSSAQKRRGKAKKTTLWSRFRLRFPEGGIGSFFASLFATLFILGLGCLIYFVHDLPDISGLAAPRKAPGIHVLAADGSIIANYGDIYGEYQPFTMLPKSLVDAVVATEDRNFFYHFGVDPFGIARAMLVNATKGKLVQGGSTITQQLAKNVFLTPERTIKRKFQEMLLAFWLEYRFTKEEILSIYLNRVYLGAGNFGVDAASRHYFGKPAENMSLSESAIIAGLLKAPSRYAPTANPELAIARGKQVLLNMVDAGYLTEEKAKKTFADYKKTEKDNGFGGQNVRYFSDWVVDQLPNYIGNVDEDIVIETTLDVTSQRLAEESMEAVMTDETRTSKKVSQGALLAMKPDGAVTAMIGGIDYIKSQYNRAVQAKRQPGSAFKFFVYLAAMENGFSPDMVIEDAPIQIGKWRPSNYTGTYAGPITLRQAVAQSINTVAVLVSQQVGISQVLTAARRLGVTSKLPSAPSVALGSAEVTLLEMTTAYAHMASGGMGVRPYGIKRILRKSNQQVLYQHTPVQDYIVVSSNVVAMMNSMLSSVIESGTARGAAIGRSAAGKTGTTSDYKDAWFIGYTPNLITGVWVGNDDSTPTQKVTGGQIPARIWAGFMKQALAKTSIAWLPTSYVSEQAVLPWNMPQGLFDTPAGNTPQPQPSPDLSPSFWDKLFDGNKVEYDYPGR